MVINVYFLDKTVSFRTEIAPRERFDAVLVAVDAIPRAKVLKILDTCNTLAVMCDNPQQVFKKFAREFKNVTAAGGVVRDAEGRVLMIHRRGRWDLPKGHLERCEQLKHCARREVAEETGVKKFKDAAPLCNTYHAYDVYGVWELKNTHWFSMTAESGQQPVPQTEEDITKAEWVPRSEVGERLENTYPTIREVFDRLDKRAAPEKAEAVEKRKREKREIW